MIKIADCRDRSVYRVLSTGMGIYDAFHDRFDDAIAVYHAPSQHFVGARTKYGHSVAIGEMHAENLHLVPNNPVATPTELLNEEMPPTLFTNCSLRVLLDQDALLSWSRVTQEGLLSWLMTLRRKHGRKYP